MIIGGKNKGDWSEFYVLLYEPSNIVVGKK